MSSGKSTKARRPRRPPVRAGDARQTELPALRPEGDGRRVAITGNRGITAEDRAKIRAKVRELVADPGVAAIFFGGAIGADTEALAAALEFRGEGEFAQRAQRTQRAQREEGKVSRRGAESAEEGKVSRRGAEPQRGQGARPRLIVIVPDTVDAQPKETWETSRRADERIELGHPIRVEDRWRAYHLRNRRLVEEATELVAFWNGEPRSGTAATIGLARTKGMDVEIVEVEGGD